MAARGWVLCLWPGLAPLWRRGSWWGLAAAVGFAVVLNSALLATWGWTAMVGPTLRIFVWVGVAAMWGLAAVATRRKLDTSASETPPTETDNLFLALQTEYLQGNWFEAQRHIDALLQRDRRDTDVRLMQATLYRHTGRPAEARRELERLLRIESAAKWQLEIERELDLLVDLEQDRATTFQTDEHTDTQSGTNDPGHVRRTA